MKTISIFIVTAVTHAAVVHAQSQGAQAEILFRQGKDLMAKGQIAEACAAFDASEKLDPTTSTVLNQGNCREKNGQLATAWGLYLEAERATRTGTDELSQQMHDTAASRAAKLEPRLSTLTVTVSDDAKIVGLEILRDTDVIDVGAWNKTLPIDGGTYHITAHAPGNNEWSTTITISPERDAKTVEIPRLKSAVTPIQTKAEQPPEDPNEDAPADAPQPGSKWLPYAIGGGGVALLGGALAFELVAESTYDKSKATLDAGQQVSLWHRANVERYTAEALAVGGVASVAVATWLYLRDRGERHAIVAPAVGGNNAGLSIVGTF